MKEKHAWNSVSFGDVHDEARHTGKGTTMQGFVIQVSILVFFPTLNTMRSHVRVLSREMKQEI